jgi:hypothetical protein
MRVWNSPRTRPPNVIGVKAILMILALGLGPEMSVPSSLKSG